MFFNAFQLKSTVGLTATSAATLVLVATATLASICYASIYAIYNILQGQHPKWSFFFNALIQRGAWA